MATVSLLSLVASWRSAASTSRGSHSGKGEVSSRQGLRVLTCNVQGKDLRVKELANLIQRPSPDVVDVAGVRPGQSPRSAGPGGLERGQGREFLLASRYPIEHFEELRRPDKDYRTFAVRPARLAWNGQEIPIVAVHLMTPRRGSSR